VYARSEPIDGHSNRPGRGLVIEAFVSPGGKFSRPGVEQVCAAVVLVAELAPGGVVHRPHDREPVRPRRQSRQVLAEPHAGEFGLGGRVLAPDALGRARLGVERLVLGGAARLKDEHDRLRPAGPGDPPAGGVCFEPE
jgi:hypothetical protein